MYFLFISMGFIFLLLEIKGFYAEYFNG